MNVLEREKDPSDISFKIKEDQLILSDGNSEISKGHAQKIEAVSVDDNYVACMLLRGPIEIYKMAYRQYSKSRIAVDRVLRSDNKELVIEYCGTLPVQEGHYTDVEVCTSFSTIFTIHKNENKSIISVWNLHTHHIRGCCTIEGVVESCGVLKNLGELIVTEKWNGNQIRFIKGWRIKKRETKKNKYVGKFAREHSEQIMAKISVRFYHY